MKIQRLDLTAFGAFTDVALELDAGREGLHIIFGPNEAGKSTALRALRQLLYGIPETSADNFLHEHGKLRIGGTLSNAAGAVLQCVRRKGRKNTLLAADGSPLAEAELQKFLGGVDLPLFESMFGIDHEGLVAGGTSLVHGGGEVGKILFAAGAGIADLRAVQQRFEQEMQTLFLPTGKNPRINQTLLDLDKTRKQIRELELPSASWQQHDQEHRQALERKRALETQLADKERERARLQRFQEALPILAERQTRLAQSDALAGAVLLAEDFSERRRQAGVTLSQARATQQEMQAELARLDAAIAELTAHVPQPLLERSASVEELYRRLGSHQKAANDRSKLSVELAGLEVEAKRILAELRPGMELDRASELRLGAADRARIQTLAAEQQALANTSSLAEEKVAEIRRKIEEAEKCLAALEMPRDVSTLRHALRRIQQAGPLEEQLDNVRMEIMRAKRQAAVDLRALPLWSGSLEDLEALPVPADETLDRFEQEIGSLEQHRGQLYQLIKQSKDEQADLERDLDRLRLEQDVPREEDLVRARQRRDELWRQWRSGSGGNTLADDYEQSVRHADHLADRLRREAGRVANQAQLLTSRKKSAERLQVEQRELEVVEEHCRHIQATWAHLWQPLGITPGTPREMRAWRRQREALITQIKSLRILRTQAVSLEERLASHRGELDEALRSLDEKPQTGKPLAMLVSQAERVHERLDSATTERRQLAQTLGQLRKDLPQAESQAWRTRQQLTDWQERWAECMKLLGRDGRATVAEANALVAGIVDLQERLSAAASHRERIRGIERDAEAFQADVHKLAEQVAGDLRAVAVEEAAEGLHTRLTLARAASDQLKLLAGQQQQGRAKLQQAQTAIADMEAELDGLCREAGCAKPEDLPAAEEKSGRLRRLTDELRDLEKQLLQRSAGSPLADFVNELLAIDADTFEPHLGRCTSDIQELRQEQEQLALRIGGARALLETMDGGDKAAEAAEQVQVLLAQLNADADQYARLRLAARVLQRGIERYRDKHQAPILQRAGELFARLTLGSFTGLCIDTNDARETVLLGVRPGGKTVSIPGMSEGTCDQLYLALRLASLEAFLARHEPLPLILDDILIHFDNERAAAVLQVLAEFSSRTQIIFFTHHAHLVELAEHHLDGAVLFTHRLEREPRPKDAQPNGQPSPDAEATLIADVAQTDSPKKPERRRRKNRPV